MLSSHASFHVESACKVWVQTYINGQTIDATKTQCIYQLNYPVIDTEIKSGSQLLGWTKYLIGIGACSLS